jgi:hypothetical protein
LKPIRAINWTIRLTINGIREEAEVKLLMNPIAVNQRREDNLGGATDNLIMSRAKIIDK